MTDHRRVAPASRAVAPADGLGSGAIESPSIRLDLTIARLLAVGTYISVTLLAIGVVILVAAGRSPLEADIPAFDVARVPADLASLRPEGPLWLGLLVVLAMPSARVAASLIGYLRSGERTMAIVATAILAVVAIGVVVGVALGAGPES